MTKDYIEEIIKQAKVYWGNMIGSKSNQFDHNRVLENILKTSLKQLEEKVREEIAKKEIEYWVDIFYSDILRETEFGLDIDEVIKRFARIEIRRQEKIIN